MPILPWFKKPDRTDRSDQLDWKQVEARSDQLNQQSNRWIEWTSRFIPNHPILLNLFFFSTSKRCCFGEYKTSFSKLQLSLVSWLTPNMPRQVPTIGRFTMQNLSPSVVARSPLPESCLPRHVDASRQATSYRWNLGCKPPSTGCKPPSLLWAPTLLS